MEGGRGKISDVNVLSLLLSRSDRFMPTAQCASAPFGLSNRLQSSTVCYRLSLNSLLVVTDKSFGSLYMLDSP